MNLIFGLGVIRKSLPILLAVLVSACARSDYNPTIFDGSQKSFERNEQSQTHEALSAGHILVGRGDTLYGIARRHGIGNIGMGGGMRGEMGAQNKTTAQSLTQ